MNSKILEQQEIAYLLPLMINFFKFCQNIGKVDIGGGGEEGKQ